MLLVDTKGTVIFNESGMFSIGKLLKPISELKGCIGTGMFTILWVSLILNVWMGACILITSFCEPVNYISRTYLILYLV